MWSRLSQPVGGAPAWTIMLIGAAAVGLVPWSVVVSTQLAGEHVVRHWDVAWVGFDVGLGVALLATVIAAVRASPWFPGFAMAAAAILLCDAWFDIVTSTSRLDLRLALASAAAVELPLGVVCVVATRSFLARAQPMGEDHSAS